MAFVLEDAARATLYTIRDKAQDVFSTLQRGYPESVYQRALGIEFQKQNIRHDMEVTMSISYKDHVVGQVRADIILRGEIPVVIETKATAAAIKVEERWQLSRYLKIQDIPLGVLINFPQISGKMALQIEFLIKDEDKIYIYDLDANTAREL